MVAWDLPHGQHVRVGCRVAWALWGTRFYLVATPRMAKSRQDSPRR